MFEPLTAAGRWLRDNFLPRNFRSKYLRLNFITVHYLYLIGWTLVGSIIVYGAGVIDYTDALFFAAGSSTQSGLNTINVNDLELYQQITFYIISCVTNPIWINTGVVFVRLYWFEKRFEHIVKDIREARRSRAKTITKTKSEMKEDISDPDRIERGVAGREIRVLHETTQPNGMSGSTARTNSEAKQFLEKMGLEANAKQVEPTPEASNASSGSGSGRDGRTSEETSTEETAQKENQAPQAADPEHHLGLHPKLHREITFADEVKSPTEATPNLARVPERADMSKHIEFLERQNRNAKEGSTLHIPGPRAFDRGELPQKVNERNSDELDETQTRDTLTAVQSESEREGMNTRGTEEMNLDDHPARGGIRFDEQEHPGRHHENDTFETAPTHSSNALGRIKSGLSHRFHHRRGNSLHLTHGKESIARSLTGLTQARSRESADTMPYLSWQATTGRNSAFLGLTEEQREELGGIEYRSLKTLTKTLLVYFFGFHLLGVIVLTPWIVRTQPWKGKVEHFSQDPAWWGVFTAASLFNDLGLTLTPNSMIGFQLAVLPLLFGSFLIVIGNTGFPIMLRFIIWLTSKITPYGSRTWEELRFLLDHPRRCFTLLFPARATWWLFWILVALNGLDLIFFIILDLNDPAVTSIPPGFRVLDGWFQAVSTRTAGFACVNLAHLHPAIQVSYMVMMYISVFPIAISVRRTNVYEEKSLGVFSGEEEEGEGNDPSYVGQHLRRQLSFDLWYIFLGFFIICIVEGNRLADNNDPAFNMFAVLFEIVSAYGTVGLSLGYTGIDASFSAEFKVLSKLVIVAMMIRGRHRGLPYALDRAILLPSEQMQKKEAEEADRQASRRRGSIFAEGHEHERHGLSWSQTEIDNLGLPRQHTAPEGVASGSAIRDDSPEVARPLRRRTSAFSERSGNKERKRGRSMSIGRVIAGGLSAGPTYGRDDR